MYRILGERQGEIGESKERERMREREREREREIERERERGGRKQRCTTKLNMSLKITSSYNCLFIVCSSHAICYKTQ